jgi:hypothetical protein
MAMSRFNPKHLLATCAALLLVAGLAAPAAAQNGAAAAAPESVDVAAPAAAMAMRAAPGAPQLDGKLDDEAWQAAPMISDFTQRDPDEGEPGTERTEARVLYTNDALYVAVRAYDSQADEISGRLTRRDDWSPSDWIGVMIDSYYDRRTAFYFMVNAAGVKRDIYMYDDNDRDDSWNAVWDVATSRDPEGWTAEFRIPFSQLRFSANQEQFGFNVYRRINRLNEEQYWRMPPKDQSGMVSQFGDLVGLQGVKPPRRVEVLPYVSASGTRVPGEDGNPFLTGKEQNAAAGADFTIGLTSNFTLQGTINPDFGQVEADPAVVNLSAFETFFPEQRPFFLEGLDMFRFSLGGGAEQLFYTRRIGRSPQGSAEDRGGYAENRRWTTILGAAKLTGKTSDGWTLGFTGALTAEEEARSVDSVGTEFRDVVEPRTWYGVARVARDFRGGQTQIGISGTGMHRGLTDNLDWLRSDAYTLGVNVNHRFLGDRYSVDGYVVGSHVRGSAEAIDNTQLSSARYYQRPDNDYVTYDPTRTSLGGFAGDVTFQKRTGDWRGATGISTRSPGFEVNDVGFQRDADYHNQWIWAQRRWQEPGKVFRRFFLNFNQWSVWNYGWDHVNAGGNVNFNWTFSNYWGGYGGIGRQTGGLSSTALRGGPGFLTPAETNGWWGFWTDQRKTFSGEISGWFGREDQSGSWYWGLETGVSWRLASNMDFMLAPELSRSFSTWQYLQTDEALGSTQYVFGEIEQTTVSMTLRANLTFTPTLSLQVYAEPFVSAGAYDRYKQVDDPRGATFDDQFFVYTDDQLTTDDDGNTAVDLNLDGTADIDIGNPNFTVLSFRSNVVLRWEYMLGSTMFLVWQHGRSGFENDGSFKLGSQLNELWHAPSANTLMVKINYWLSL